MAWTSPMTAVANTAFTAAQFNTHVRDNLNESAPAKATTAGRLLVTSGLNSIVERNVDSDTSDPDDTTTSTSYGDLSSSSGPAVTITTGAKALVLLTCRMSNSGSQSSFCSYDVSGASSVSASDGTGTYAAGTQPTRQATDVLEKSLTPGSNTFSTKFRVAGGTGTFRHVEIIVLAL